MYNLGRIDDAVNACKTAEEKNPSYFDVHKDFGELYITLKEYKLAERELALAPRHNVDKYDEEVINGLLDVKLAGGDATGYINMLADIYAATGDARYIKLIIVKSLLLANNIDSLFQHF